jgi:magnesium transporter
VPVFDGRKLIRMASIQDLVLRLIYQSTFHFEEHIKVISLCSDEIERGINSSINNRQLLNMFTLEKSLVFYLEAIASNRRVIDKIKATAVRLKLSTPQIEFLEDIAIENEQCYDMAQIYSQVISGLMDARASVISNNLNVLMKNLNAMVIAIAIPTFITGIGGMSEFTSVIGEPNRLIGYGLFTASMISLGSIIFLLIRKSERFWTTR